MWVGEKVETRTVNIQEEGSNTMDTGLEEAIAGLEAAEDRLLAADEGYSLWLQQLDLEARQQQEEEGVDEGEADFHEDMRCYPAGC